MKTLFRQLSVNLRKRINNAREFWRALSPAERRLIGGLSVHLSLVAIFFVWQIAAIKYIMIILGTALAGLLSEFARKSVLVVMVVLICSATTVVQIFDDRNDEKRETNIERKLEMLQLDRNRESEIRENERRAQEQERVELDPLDAVESLRYAGTGFLAKAESLSLKARLAEAKLIAAFPTLTTTVLSFSEAPSIRLRLFQRLAQEPALRNDDGRTAVNAVVLGLQHESRYRMLAATFDREVRPAYDALIRDAQIQKPNLNVIKQRLAEIEQSLVGLLCSNSVAGLYNHLGVLAMASDAKERALGYFYSGIALDPQHFPLYESLAYALWAINQDSINAMQYASSGIKLCESLVRSLVADRTEVARNRDIVVKQQPQINAQLTDWFNKVDSQFVALTPSVKELAEYFDGTLRLLFAYTSALELKNEPLAREYVSRLYEADKTDAEYQDALGLVLLRFAKDPTELNRAEGLFKDAFANPKATALTKQLAAVHLKELQNVRAKLSLKSRIK